MHGKFVTPTKSEYAGLFPGDSVPGKKINAQPNTALPTISSGMPTSLSQFLFFVQEYLQKLSNHYRAQKVRSFSCSQHNNHISI